MVLILEIFVFSRNFATRQIRGCWFQIWQYYFQISAQKYPNQAFLVPNLTIFIFAPNFGTRKIRGRWFQIWQKYFQVPVRKYSNQVFLVPNLVIFIFAPNFATRQIQEDADFKYNNSIFKFQPKNAQITYFWSQF